MNGSVRSRPTKGAISGSRNGVLEDPDSLDLDFEAIPGLEVASAVASLQLASSGNRPAAPHFTRVDRLESGEELEHLRERPEGSLAFADPRVLVDERAVSIAQPFLVVHAHDDRLVPQLSELVAGHDTRPEGVRPILPRSGPHAGAARRRLEISGREIVEDGHTEEMSIGLRRVDVPPALTEDEADLSLVIHRSEEHTSELQSPYDLVCRLLLEKKKKNKTEPRTEHKKHSLHSNHHQNNSSTYFIHHILTLPQHPSRRLSLPPTSSVCRLFTTLC